MRPTRRQQPYRATGSRGATPVLDTMRRGRSAIPQNALILAASKRSASKRRKAQQVPRAPRLRY
jgi:hypothetical protein